jgi:hypothetical protein
MASDLHLYSNMYGLVCISLEPTNKLSLIMQIRDCDITN